MCNEAMLEVLERAADDMAFYSRLAQDPQTLLKYYTLTSEERCAVTYGDVRFIESRIGRKLDKKIMDEVMIPLLSRESWW